MARTNYHITYFVGSKKGEILDIEGEKYSLPVGTISKYLLETDDSIWDSLKDIAHAITQECNKENLTPVICEELSVLLPVYDPRSFFSQAKTIRTKRQIAVADAVYRYQKERFDAVKSHIKSRDAVAPLIDLVIACTSEWEGHALHLYESVVYHISKENHGRDELLYLIDEMERYDRNWQSDLQNKLSSDGFAVFQAINVLNALNIAKRIRTLPIPRLLQELILCLPCQHEYMKLFRTESRLDFTDRERKQILRDLRDPNTSYEYKKQISEEFYSRLNYVSPYQNETYFWSCILDNIRNGHEGFICGPECLLDTVRKYGQLISDITSECKKLKQLLSYATGIEKSEDELNSKQLCMEDIQNIFDTPSKISENIAQKIFPDYKCREKESAYMAVSFSALVWLEMDILHGLNPMYKKCSFCGGYFVPFGNDSIYCKYPNTLHGGRICQDVAPQIVYKKKTPLHEKFYNKRDTYNKWIRSHSRTDSKQNAEMKALRSLFDSNHEFIVDCLKPIVDEMEAVFDQWKKSADDALERYCSNLISEDACKEFLELPPICDRSPLLQNWLSKLIGL